MSKPYYQDESVTLWHGDCRLEPSGQFAGRAWRQGVLKGHHTDNLNGIANDHSTGVRDDVLSLWGDRPAACFGDLMLPPPVGTKQVLIYRKPSNAGLRGAMARFRRDAEAVYLLGEGLGSGIGGESSVLTTGATKVGSGAAAGVSTGTIVNVMRANRPRVKAGTAHELLRLDWADLVTHQAAADKTPALGSRRRIEALIWAGWTVNEIATAAGVHHSNVDRVLHGHRPTITTRTALGIDRAFRAMWDKQQQALRRAGMTDIAQRITEQTQEVAA